MSASGITPGVFVRFSWQHRADLARYLRWAAENSTGEKIAGATKLK
jgi:hypothetical protein